MRQWHIMSSNMLCFTGVTLFLNVLKLNQSYYLEKSERRAERSGTSGCFSFQFPCLSRTTGRDRPKLAQQQGAIRGCSQAKNHALEKSVKFLTWLKRCLSPHPAQQTYRVCVLEVALTSPKQLGYITVTESHIRTSD